MFQQPLLSPQAAGIANKGLIAAYDSVTGNNDGDAVFAIGRGRSPDALGVAEPLCKGHVADGLPIANV